MNPMTSQPTPSCGKCINGQVYAGRDSKHVLKPCPCSELKGEKPVCICDGTEGFPSCPNDPSCQTEPKDDRCGGNPCKSYGTCPKHGCRGCYSCDCQEILGFPIKTDPSMREGEWKLHPAHGHPKQEGKECDHGIDEKDCPRVHTVPTPKSGGMEETMDERVRATATWLHETYENSARLYGWTTQEKTRVPFVQLPEANAKTMLSVALQLEGRISQEIARCEKELNERWEEKMERMREALKAVPSDPDPFKDDKVCAWCFLEMLDAFDQAAALKD